MTCKLSGRVLRNLNLVGSWWFGWFSRGGFIGKEFDRLPKFWRFESRFHPNKFGDLASCLI